MAKLLIALLACVPLVAVAAGGGPVDSANIELESKASLQNGARLYANYCLGCHSLEFMRYSRLQEDLALSDEVLQNNFLLGGGAPGDLMTIAMDEQDAENWLGKTPPDLSVIARSRGVDWLYTFLRSYYIDPSQPSGWNNTLFANTSMPHVLWSLQGIPALAVDDLDPEQGEAAYADEAKPSFELMTAGNRTPEQYDQDVRDIVTFLAYVGEPAYKQRIKTGVWVLLFLVLFAFLAWLLKNEYWQDVH